MGWNGSSLLMNRVIDSVQENVGDPDKRLYIYTDLIDAFNDMDGDTLHECLGRDAEYDRAYKQWHVNNWGLEDYRECFESEGDE